MVNEKTQAEQDQPQVDSNEQTMSSPDKVPTRRLLHKFFILVSVVTALVALWMAAGQILGIVVYENGPVEYVLRGYVILLCLLVCLIELEWPAFARESSVLHNWVSRGLLYVFIGVIGLQENETSTVKNEEYVTYERAKDVLKAVAWNMIGCGVLYVVMGILCLQLLLRRMRRSYQARLELAKKRKKQAQEGSTNDIEAQSGDALELDDGLKAKDTSMDSDESHQESDAANEAQQSSADDVSDVEAQKEHEAENSSVDSDGSSAEDVNEGKDEESAASSDKAEKV